MPIVCLWLYAYAYAVVSPRRCLHRPLHRAPGAPRPLLSRHTIGSIAATVASAAVYPATATHPTRPRELAWDFRATSHTLTY